MVKAHILPLSFLVLATAARGEGQPLRICVSNQPAAPLTYPDKDGISPDVIRASAAKLKREVIFEVKPRVRCLVEARAGHVDALAMAGSTHELISALVYPMQGQSIDATRGFGPYRAYLVRYRNATLEWDGKTITGANLPVPYPAGMTAAREKLQETRTAGSESFKSTKELVHLLLNRRAQAVVLREADALAVTGDAKLKDQLELLQPAFFTINIYVPFNREYYRLHREFVEAFWDEIGRHRQ